MTENDALYPDEHQLAAALAEELDAVEPRRDLWPLVQAGLRLAQPRRRWRWLVPALTSAAVVVLAFILIVPLTVQFAGSGESAARSSALDYYGLEGGSGFPQAARRRLTTLPTTPLSSKTMV